MAGFQSRPEYFLPLLLDAWPDALEHCREAEVWTAPLHRIAGGENSTYGSRMQCIEIFMQKSSLAALAVALTDTNSSGSTGFHLVKESLSHQAPNGSTDWRTHMDETVKTLAQRKDHHGRNLLHYVAAKKGSEQV